MSTSPDADAGPGAYGFRVAGMPPVAIDHLPRVSADRPVLDVSRAPLLVPRPEQGWTADGAVVHLLAGEVLTLQRAPLAATFHLRPTVEDADLAHPYLTNAAGLAAHWQGWTAYHAGAIVGADGAWLVAGDREAGKSTLLAHLALAGVDVLADDLANVEDNEVHVGPRTIDLRAPTAERLAADGVELVTVRHATRRRLRLGGAPLRVPLAGWLLLEVADAVTVTPVPPRERPRAVVGQGFLVRPSGVPVLDAVTVPVVRLGRPKRWDAMAETVAAVRQLLDGS